MATSVPVRKKRTVLITENKIKILNKLSKEDCVNTSRTQFVFVQEVLLQFLFFRHSVKCNVHYGNTYIKETVSTIFTF